MRPKVFILIIALLCIFGAATGTAQAELRGETSEGSGKQIGVGTLEVTGGIVTCETSNEKWRLPNNPGLLLDIKSNLEGCTATIAGVKSIAKVKEGCELSIEYVNLKSGTTSHLSTCVITVPTLECTITVGAEGNKGLELVDYENQVGVKPISMIIKINVPSLTYTTNCKELTSGKTAKRKDELLLTGVEIL